MVLFFRQHFVYVLWAEINEKFALRADHLIYPTLNIARIVNAVHVTFWLSATNPRCQLVHYGTVSRQKLHFFGHCPNYPTQSWFSCSQLLEKKSTKILLVERRGRKILGCEIRKHKIWLGERFHMLLRLKMFPHLKIFCISKKVLEGLDCTFNH